LIRSLFMGGEVYALSADLVQYVATYEPLLALTNGPEDKRVAKWIRIHPERSMINWVTERCWIYDHPKAGTTYSHGFLFPDEVERIRLEGQQGIEEEERIRRGGDLSQAYSTVTQWKKEYKAPMSGLSMEEEVEALVEGGGRWATWRADAGKGPESVRYDSVVFERDDSRIVEESPLARGVDADEVGVKPGVPDRTVQLPTARLTKFGKDLFRDPADVDAVKVVKRSEGEDFNVVVHNAVPAPASDAVDEDDEKEKAWSSVFATSSSSTTSSSSSASDLPLSSSDSPSATDAPSSQSTTSTSSASESAAPAPSDLPPVDAPVESVPDSDSPSKQIRLPAHNYILPPDTDDLFIPPPTLRYDPETLSVRQRRMLNLPHGGTVAVHFLKRNEWFLEAALALIGREKLWDSGIEAPAVMPGVEVLNQETMEMEVSRMPVWQGVGTVEAVDAVWGGARQYGSPIVREGGYVDLGRKAEARREVVSSVGSTNTRIGNFRGPMLGFRLEEGEEAKIGGGLQVQQPLVVE
ncbi:glycosyltransferase family 31 protein, partial [Pseudohyphozyma bogoriensis]